MSQRNYDGIEFVDRNGHPKADDDDDNEVEDNVDDDDDSTYIPQDSYGDTDDDSSLKSGDDASVDSLPNDEGNDVSSVAMETNRSEQRIEDLHFSLKNNYGACKNISFNRDDNTQSKKCENGKSSGKEPRELLVWRKPWIIAMVFFSAFFFIWSFGVVIKRYWIDERFELVLPGLAKNALRKHSMRLHMTFGALAILCSLIQMITPFTSGWKSEKGTSITRNFYRRIHRYGGRIYVMCAIMAFLFGQWFIILKEFILVGGYNMGVSFSLSGVFIAYFAYMTWKTAPSKTIDSKYSIEDHRNYAIRSFSQIIAPILYRFWYGILMIFQIYRTPPFYGAKRGQKLICDDRNVCRDYLRPFDIVYCWLYWISAWIIAEIIIACLPRHQTETITTKDFVQGDETQSPLLINLHPKKDENMKTGSSTTQKYIIQEKFSSTYAIENRKNDPIPFTSVVNYLGCILAALIVMGTSPVLYLFVSSIVRKSRGFSAA